MLFKNRLIDQNVSGILNLHKYAKGSSQLAPLIFWPNWPSLSWRTAIAPQDRYWESWPMSGRKKRKL